MKTKAVIAATALLLYAAPVPAVASLIGDSVQGDLQIAGGNSSLATCPNGQRLNVSQNFTSPATVDATGTPEFSGTIGVCDGAQPTATITDLDWSVDIQDSRLVYTMGIFDQEEEFSIAILLDDLNWVDFPAGTITGLTVTQDDIGLSNTLFSANSVSVAFDPNFPTTSPTTTIIDLQVSHDIPVPSTLALLAAGLAVLWRRPRRHGFHKNGAATPAGL